MAYATTSDVETRLGRTFDDDDTTLCAALLADAAVIIDAFAEDADGSVKALVSSRMVVRAMGDGEAVVPTGATQGSMSGLGYSQSWTYGTTGAAGELYLSKMEKQLLGRGNRIGSYSPVEALVEDDE